MQSFRLFLQMPLLTHMLPRNRPATTGDERHIRQPDTVTSFSNVQSPLEENPAYNASFGPPFAQRYRLATISKHYMPNSLPAISKHAASATFSFLFGTVALSRTPTQNSLQTRNVGSNSVHFTPVSRSVPALEQPGPNRTSVCTCAIGAPRSGTQNSFIPLAR